MPLAGISAPSTGVALDSPCASEDEVPALLDLAIERFQPISPCLRCCLRGERGRDDDVEVPSGRQLLRDAGRKSRLDAEMSRDEVDGLLAWITHRDPGLGEGLGPMSRQISEAGAEFQETQRLFQVVAEGDEKVSNHPA